MDETEILENKSHNTVYSIIITEAVAVLIILITLLAVKFFFGGTYKKVLNWYEKNICTETSVNEVIETAGGGIDEV